MERITDNSWPPLGHIVFWIVVALLAFSLAVRGALGDGVAFATAAVDDLTGASLVVTNVTLDISGKADKTNTYTKAETDAKIVELSPPTSLEPSFNYTDAALGAFAATGTVRKAKSANEAAMATQADIANFAYNLYSLPDWTPWTVASLLKSATNYTDAALGSFAATGMVARTTTYGTPTRWTDSTGCVWEVVIDSQWSFEFKEPEYGPQYGIHLEPSGLGNGTYWLPMSGDNICGEAKGDEDSTVLVWTNEAITDFTATRTLVTTTNLVGRVAMTSDIPDVPPETDPTVPNWAKAPSKPTYTASEVGATDGEAVTNIVRQMSLGGIYDSELGVWWTPHMKNGAYYWTATTNVNLAVEGNE